MRDSRELPYWFLARVHQDDAQPRCRVGGTRRPDHRDGRGNSRERDACRTVVAERGYPERIGRRAPGPFGGPELAVNSVRDFDIRGSGCGISSTAVAYSLNATAVPDSPLDYLTMFPSGDYLPYVSTLNSDGRIKANAAITPTGYGGAVTVYSSNPTNFVLDLDGYFVPAGTASALEFYPLPPCRVADTRGSSGPLGGPSIAAGSSRNFPVQSSNCGIPANAQAYSLNVTAVPHTTLNYLTTWPTGQAQPLVSTLNAPTGTIAANAAIVPAGASGGVSIFTSDDADVVLDVSGYFAPPSSGGL